MSRTRRRPANLCRNPYSREKAEARRQWQRAYRAKMNHLVRTGQFEKIRPPRRTSGWLTW
jgi:hypothetical protein